jgi:SAM-dependent methyltransferase
MPGAMNQHLDAQLFSVTPDLSPAALETTLARLLVPGVIVDSDIERRCRQLDARHKNFVSTCPVPEWAPGLKIAAEMRRQYELYLPLAEIRAAIAAFCKLACRYDPLLATTAVATALSWPDALAGLQPLPVSVNPAGLLRRLALSAPFRYAFLASLFIPKSFGGSFNRYPLQTDFRNQWLAANKERLSGRIAILDAACGTGEGTYEAAEAIAQLEFSPASLIDGRTIEPLELAAAAHGWFPEDTKRARAFRERVERLLASGAGRMIRFSREDLCEPQERHDSYDLILCNGFLGGPLLHRQVKLARVIGFLAQRLNTGGILLAADHFHGGWKQATPSAAITQVLTASGLQTVEAGEGIGAVKNG